MLPVSCCSAICCCALHANTPTSTSTPAATSTDLLLCVACRGIGLQCSLTGQCTKRQICLPAKTKHFIAMSSAAVVIVNNKQTKNLLQFQKLLKVWLLLLSTFALREIYFCRLATGQEQVNDQRDLRIGLIRMWEHSADFYYR